MSAQSRSRGGLRSRAPLAQWATLAGWYPQPTHLPRTGGVQRGKGRGGSFSELGRGGLLEERESNHSLLSPPTSQGGRPSSWSGPQRLGSALTAPVSLPLELFEGLTCPDSSEGWS